jgi:ATP-binding cassette, subfamily C, bacterial LapB
MHTTLLPIIEHSAMLAGQAVPRACIDDMVKQIAATDAKESLVSLVQRVWQAGQLEGEPRALVEPGPPDCPFITRDLQHGWLVVLSHNADASWLAQPSSGGKVRIDQVEGMECVSVPAKAARAGKAGSGGGSPSAAIIWRTLGKYRSVFSEALLATVLINVLALMTSVYSMQVYDRVIPHKGFSTLYVLTAGVVLAAVFNLVLSQVRGTILDKTSTLMDHELSDWFFERAMGIHLSFRPKSVGTLASQLKGLEMVRGVLSSSSLFLLADLPFAFFFIYVIYLVGGMLAVVPLLFFTVSLLSGLIFLWQIKKYTKLNQGQSNRKVGLLVESIDSIEMIKANGAEWELQARWRALLTEAAQCDDKLKQFSVLPSNIAAFLSQLAYVALVAFGAYLVTGNHMTMGGLIACSIISGRVSAPLGQFPGFMIKWGHAKSAIEGLDKLLSLPNELDDREHALIPGHLEGHLRMEKATFHYERDRAAMEITHLEVKPGEKIGIIGTIGSGKSTLLKLASGLYRPATGKIFLDGMDLAQISPRVLREAIFYLPQDIRLVSGTLRDNLLQGLPDPGDEPLLEAARQTGLFELIRSHPKGFALPIAEGGRGISGGQRQAIVLTRMILAKPKIILLDEPTASMDASTEAAIVGTLQRLVAGGCTLMVATHKSALLPILDRLLVVKDGKLFMDGPRDAVLAKLSGKVAQAA